MYVEIGPVATNCTMGTESKMCKHKSKIGKHVEHYTVYSRHYVFLLCFNIRVDSLSSIHGSSININKLYY